MAHNINIIPEFTSTGFCYTSGENIESNEEIGLSKVLYDDVLKFNAYAVELYPFGDEIFSIYSETAFIADFIGFSLKIYVEKELGNTVNFYSPTLNRIVDIKPTKADYTKLEKSDLLIKIKRIFARLVSRQITPNYWNNFHQYILKKYPV